MSTEMKERHDGAVEVMHRRVYGETSPEPSPTPIESQPGMGAVVDFSDQRANDERRKVELVLERERVAHKHHVLAGNALAFYRVIKRCREENIPMSESFRNFVMQQMYEAVEKFTKTDDEAHQ